MQSHRGPGRWCELVKLVEVIIDKPVETFGSSGIRRRWDTGYEDTARVLQQSPWRDAPDPMEGISIYRMSTETG